MDGPKVITLAYDLIKWGISHIAKFPRNQRYTLGERIENKLFDLLEHLIVAQYSKEKIVLLKEANLEIEQIRYLFRLSYDLRLINVKTYTLCAQRLSGIGVQVGGWLKQQSSK